MVGSGPSAPPGLESAVTEESPTDDGERTIGALLAIGIILFPFIFGWVVLRRGYSGVARALALGWMSLILVLGIVRVTTTRPVGPGPAGTQSSVRVQAGLADACRTRRLPVDCDCFGREFAQRATAAQAEELARAPRDPSQAVLAHIEGSVRHCADRNALAATFLSHCVKGAATQSLCECVFDRSLDTFTIPEFLELDESYANGRPPPPAFGAILTECLADPTSRGPVARGPTERPQPGAPAAAASWSVQSAGGHAVLTQTQNGLLCSLSCAVDAKEVWKDPRDCEDTPDNLHFVSDDCERWVTFYARPKPGPVTAARFISVFDRAAVAWHVVGAGVVRDQEAAKYRTHLVLGLGGNAGTPPHYSADGASVVFTNVENAPQAVPLRKDAPEQSPPRPTPKKKPTRKKPRR